MRNGWGREAERRAEETVAARMAAGAGWASLAAGLALTVAPTGSGEVGGLRVDRRVVRVYGVGDLFVVGGLLLARNWAGWMAARAVWNLVLAGLDESAVAAGTPRRGRATALLGEMVMVAGVDGVVAWRLARESVSDGA